MATQAQIRDLQRQLNRYGYPSGPVDGKVGPKTRAGVLAFQYAFLGGFAGAKPLPRTGRIDRDVLAAVKLLPRLSPNFRSTEVRCRHCHRAYVHRDLLRAMEVYRRAVGGPISPLSAYRCPTHNRNVGGASRSQHLYGRAWDMRSAQLSVAQVRRLGVFTGVGFNASTGRVSHVDVRPGGLVTWRYGR